MGEPFVEYTSIFCPELKRTVKVLPRNTMVDIDYYVDQYGRVTIDVEKSYNCECGGTHSITVVEDYS